MELVTIPRVPIMRTGHFELESGPVDFTMEHLNAAAAAFANDPAARAPRIRLELEDQGHADGAGMVAEANGGTAARSGVGPAVGWVDGLEVSGNTLYGDLHVPEAVAGAMEWAFPGRSVEGVFGYTTASGQTHDFLATGLLLLGTSWPGVTTLPDFHEVQAQAVAELAEVEGVAASYAFEDVEALPELAGSAVAARSPAEVRRAPVSNAAAARHVAAGLAVTDLRMRWYAAEREQDLEGLPDEYDFYSWYVTEQRVDDDGTLYVVVLNEATGREWRFDVASISGADVTFAEPRTGLMDWRDAPATAAAAASTRPVPTRWSSREQSRGAAASSPPSSTQQEEDRPMRDALRRSLATRHGLDPETATEEQIEAAELAATVTPPEGGATPPEGTAPVNEPEAAPVGAAARVREVDATTLEQLQADAAVGRQAAAAAEHANRDRIVLDAITDGRITPAAAGLGDRDERTGLYAIGESGWRRDLENAPDVVAGQLSRLEKGVYPGASARAGTSPQEGAEKAGGEQYARAAAGLGIRKPQTTAEVN